MATPTYSDVISQINTYIVANGNNEITANVLNPILAIITDFANNNIGDLDDLTTDEKNSIVESINSLKQNFDDLSNSGVQLHIGYDNPNDVPPATYTYADFYMQLLPDDDSPLSLWQWNGTEWTTGNPTNEVTTDDVINESDVPGTTVTDALNNLNSFSGVFEFRDYPRLLADQQTFTIPAGKTAKFAIVNYGANYFPETVNNSGEANTFIQTDNIVSFTETLVIGNYVVIFYQ